MSSVDNNKTDYTKLWNQQKAANAASLLGSAGTGSNSNVGGLSGDLLSQWAMLGANKSAYKKLLEAQKTGSIKAQNWKSHELLSDKYFNDYYDNDKKTLIKPTYKPSTSETPSIAKDATSGDVLNDMRQLALAAINNPNSLTSTHYDFFEKMRQNIAGSLVTKGSSTNSGTEVVTKEATAAELSKSFDFDLLVDDQRFTVAGKKGEVTFAFTVGQSLDDVAAAVNAETANTGVTAEVVTGEDGVKQLKFASEGTGKDQFVRIDQNAGDMFTSAGSSLSATGADAVKENAKTEVTGDDTQAAMVAGLYTGKLFSESSFTIQGRNGAQTFEFEKGATADDIAAAINAAAEKTGVKAEVIRNADGEAEGIGLLAEKAGSGNYVQVTQNTGDLFASAGRTVSVAGSSAKKGETAEPAITKQSDLGQVNIGGVTYSFADLAPGGKASLATNPDAALAVLDQTIKDIYDGRAVINGFDPKDSYFSGIKVNNSGSKSPTNTMEIGNYGSDAMTKWLARYVTKTEE